MSTNNELFKGAVAEAKQIRETALRNAKEALEETLTPKLQSMLAAKLNEIEGDDNPSDLNEEEELDEELDLNSILQELEGEEGSLAEADDESDSKPKASSDSKPKESKPAAPKSEKADDSANDFEPTEPSGADKISSLTVDELKDLISQTVASAVGGGEMGGGLDDVPADANMGGAGEDLGGDMGGSPEMGAADSGFPGGEDDDVDLDELLNELSQMDDNLNEEEVDESLVTGKAKVNSPQLHEVRKTKKDLQEAIKTIKYLRKELNEVNLLNAKLLYVNRIFKSKNLTESQKVKVITTFDKVSTTKDAKLVYEALQGSLSTSAPKKNIKESMGFASKAAGAAQTKRNPSSIVDEASIARMQLLAGIKKK